MTSRYALRDSLAKVIRTCNVKGGWRLVPWLNRWFARGEAVVRLPRVGRCLLDLADDDQSQIYWAGPDSSDRRIMRLVRRLLPTDGVFLDVGANIGLHSLAAARHLQQGSGRVLAFEPHPANFDFLRRNLALNDLGNVHAEPLGLSDAKARLTVHGSDRPGNWSLASLGPKEFRVDVVRLDDYLEGQFLGRIDVLKIDVEGGEVQALRGAEETLRRYRPALLFEACPSWLRRMGTNVVELFGVIQHLDYTIHHLPRRPNRLGPVLTGSDLEHLDDQSWLNLLAVPVRTAARRSFARRAG